MPCLLDELDDSVYISYRQFMLHGVRRLHSAEPANVIVEMEDQVYVYLSDGRCRIEAWDEESPAPDGSWQAMATARCVADTGVVGLSSLMSGGSGRRILIGPPFFEYGLRIFVGAQGLLLRFWPIKDVFDPTQHARPAGLASTLIPADVVEVRSQFGDWPSSRPLPALPTPRGRAAMGRGLSNLIPPGLLPAELTADQGGDSPKTEGVDWEADMSPEWRENQRKAEEDQRQVDELLGDLRWQVLTHAPFDLMEWPEESRDRYLNELRSGVRIAKRLNPDGMRTFRLRGEDIQLSTGRAPGLSCRAWCWGAEDEPWGDTLMTSREVLARDVLGRRQLITGIVTILRGENGVVEVRDATGPEIERVVAAERTWAKTRD
ncbi:hypothetical protein ABZ260_08010 [Streptosporangium sp. NPDC006013]|uniref:hypothetical protein n=1 Tax=Streptosporangium sp. NPDC006013 TaxID=3155596 RepID=UPI0033B3135A